MNGHKQIQQVAQEIRHALGQNRFVRATSAQGFSIRRLLGVFAVVVLAVIILAVRGGGENQKTVAAGIADPSHSLTESGLASARIQFDDPLPTDRGLPDIHVTAALVKELGAQNSIFTYRPRARWPIASITKLMTAMVAMDELGPATIVDISQEAADTEGDSGNLKAGEKYSVNDLIRAMLVVSSNDAAVALAQAYDSRQLGKDAYEKAINKTALFTALMQQRARSFGMPETYFGDPSGLSMVNQSVVGDLAILVDRVLALHPELFDTTRQKSTTILERVKWSKRTLVNINQFAGQKDFLGGKTGFTTEAGQNLITVFEYAGKKYLIIVLGTEDRFGETSKLYEWLKVQKLP